MKKTVSLILIFTFILTLIPTYVSADGAAAENTVEIVFDSAENAAAIVTAGGAAPRIKYGDANGDGTVNLRDSMQLKKFVAGTSVEIDAAASDLNGDGQVNIKDLNLLKKLLVGDETTIANLPHQPSGSGGSA